MWHFAILDSNANSGLQRKARRVCGGNQLNRSQSLFYFVPQDSHNKAGSTRNPRKLLLAFPSCTMYKPPRYVQCTEQCTELKHSCKKKSVLVGSAPVALWMTDKCMYFRTLLLMPCYKVYFYQMIKKAPRKKVAPWRLLGAFAPFQPFFWPGALRLQQL